MDTILKAFFDQFAKDFSLFSGELIANRYATPYTAIKASGESMTLEDYKAIAEYFQSYLNEYQSQGIATCDYELIHQLKTGEMTYLALVKWYLKNSMGSTVLSWKESYNLVEKQGELFVYSSSDFK